jgi:hypothetical protein
MTRPIRGMLPVPAAGAVCSITLRRPKGMASSLRRTPVLQATLTRVGADYRWSLTRLRSGKGDGKANAIDELFNGSLDYVYHQRCPLCRFEEPLEFGRG